MAVPNVPTATDRAGKPIAITEAATIQGFITAISGTGQSAVVTIQLAGSGASVNVQGQDIGATTQTT